MAQVTGTGVPAPASEALGDSGLASRKGEDPQASSARTAVEADLGDEDVRGQAVVTPQGTVVRAHKGSKRPPGIDPYVWTLYSRKQRADEVARYEKELEARRKSKQAVTGDSSELVLPSANSSAAAVSGPGGSESSGHCAAARKVPSESTEVGQGNMPGTLTVPCMAVLPAGSQPHRSRIPEVSLPYTVAVSRKVKRAEVERVPATKAAVDAEWKKLAEMPHPDGKGVGVWDITSVRESSDVRREAQRKGITIHFGMVAELCFEKNVDQVVGAEPGKAPKASPAVYKGRHVFLGDSVKDQNFD